MSARIESFAKQILQAIPKGAKVLEVGAGEGELARTLATAGYEVIAVDREQRSTFPTLICDFADYDAAGDTFDCVVASLVLHHAPDLEQMLVKMRALLKPGGIVAIDDYGWEILDEAEARARWGGAWEPETTKWRASGRACIARATCCQRSIVIFPAEFITRTPLLTMVPVRTVWRSRSSARRSCGRFWDVPTLLTYQVTILLTDPKALTEIKIRIFWRLRDRENEATSVTRT